MKSISNALLQDKSSHAPTLPILPAYSALQKRFREWLESEKVRAGDAGTAAEQELNEILYEVTQEYYRCGLKHNFDFDSCSLDEKAAGLYKRYLALSVVRDVENLRYLMCVDALERGDIAPAYHEFISCHDSDLLDLHVAMVEEMFAGSCQP